MHRLQSTRFQGILRRIAAIDLRSLAAFRIGLAVCLLWDLAISLDSVKAFYSDEGFLPRALLGQFQTSPWMGSIHTWSGSVAWQVVLLAVHIAAAFCLLVGYRTQISIIVCWALLCSIQTRNPAILNSGDVVLRLFCFWAMFLPLGARWSVDGKDKMESETSGEPVSSPASLAILVQLGVIYWMGALVKNGIEWLQDGTAVYYALSLDQFITPTGRHLLNYPELCRALTFGTWWLEMTGAFMIFIPCRLAAWRILAVALFWTLHLGLWISFRLGTFPLIMMTGWLLCVPATAWDRLLQRLRGHQGLSPVAEISSAEPRWMRRPLTRWFVSFCLAYVIVWNCRNVSFRTWHRVLPEWANLFGYVLQLHQYWTMFAPRPTTDDGWVVMEATLADGSSVDLLRQGRPLTFAKPPVISAEFEDAKWQKMILNLWRSPYEGMRASFGNHIASEWNGSRRSNLQIRNWVLWYIREDTPPPVAQLASPQTVKIELLKVGAQ